ncbi:MULTISPECIES: helix-turn-helix domain-containing protein [Microvirga]|uniref:helix-turn-helix domain-containing protein n=1 Tax=Microvirga TaxID=186650 RepID=UPI001CFFE0A9|nr:helix-turn-helix transcriptional regulator [Microvirga lenta]MCB5175127.1 helix-turn-helix domain-containing protein [Microvirga lenta]
MSMVTKSTGPVDKIIGARIRLQRTAIGMSQEKLGDILGITFQQIQKYEKGTNRVGAARLQAIADALRVPVSFFFEQRPVSADAPDAPLGIQDLLTSKEGIELARAFLKIENPAMRRALIDMARAAATDSQNQD